MTAPEFAEEYSPSERKRLLALLGFGGLLLVLACELYLFPWLRWFASTSHCHQVMGIHGTTILWYGIFVGVPLHGAILAGLVLLPSALRSIKTRRFPPPGTKVFRRTQVTIGWQAVLRGYAACGMVAVMLAIAVWGYFQAKGIDQTHRDKKAGMSECAANNRLQWDVLAFGEAAPEPGRYSA